jgi:hypothetical protein
VDTNNVPFGDARLKAVLDAVVAGGDTTETDFLEAKGDIDLAVKLGQAKVAKFVLAVANRLPSQAAKNFHGYAVLVIGAAKGSVPGVPIGTEAHELHDQIARYVGPNGPSFDLTRLPVSDDREVLFVIVDPPELGQPPYLCHSDFQPDGKDAKHGMRDGDIYLRVKSSTRRATAVEVQALFARATTALRVPVDLLVSALGTLTPILDGDALFEGLVDIEAGEVRKDPPMIGSKFNSLLPRTSGARPMTEQQVETHIERWTEDLTATWESRLDYLAGATLPGLALRVVNKAASYLSKPRIDIILHGCRGVEWRDPRHSDFSEISPPVIKQSTNPWDVSLSMARIAPAQFAQYPVSWENTDEGLVITLTPDALRPQTPWDTDSVDVVVRPPTGVDFVRGSWFATAEGIGERFVGEFTILVDSGQPAVKLYRSLLPI